MSDELSTKVSLDLDMEKVSKHLEDITSSVNDMLQGIEKAKTGLKELGPAGEKSLDNMSDSIGTLDQKLRALVNDLGNAHGDPEA